MFSKRNYYPLSREAVMKDKESLLGGDLKIHVEKQREINKHIHFAIHGICATIIICLIIALHLATQTSRAKCWDMFNYYSPVNDAVVPYPSVPKLFNGSLWHESPWKGPPTDEVERAWYSIMKYGMISVTKQDIEKIDHPNWSAQFPPEVGGGYIAATIGTHQLHCLHYIWQDHYIDHVPIMQDKKKTVPELYERHYEHCVDYIRQSLMCQFDTGIIPYNWVLDHQNPTPNANTHHTCVDWDALQDWLKKRRVEVPEGFVWTQPEDAVSMGWNP